MYVKSLVTEGGMIEGEMYKVISLTEEFGTGIILVNGRHTLIPLDIVVPHVAPVIRVDFTSKKKIDGNTAA